MQNDYLIKERPLKALLLFSLPIILGNLFQQTYTMADSAIVGRFVGEQALAAVGASYSLTNIFICVAFGGGIGASVIVSRYFGAGQYRAMKLAVYTAFSGLSGRQRAPGRPGTCRQRGDYASLKHAGGRAGYGCGIPEYLFSGPSLPVHVQCPLVHVQRPGEIPDPSVLFDILLLFNIVLDVISVTWLNMGVAGVAWATLIAQGISAVLSFIVFMRLMGRLSKEPSGIFDRSELISMTKIALPSILQQSTVSIGMMLVQSVVNSFGSQALAGFSAGMRIESICVVPMSGVGSAISSYTAQNIGAGSEERVVKGFRAAIQMVIAFAVILCVALQLFHEPLIALFLGDEGTAAALSTGQDYLKFIGWFFCLSALR